MIHVEIVPLNVLSIIAISILIALMLLIIFFISRRRRGNLLFSFKIHKNPIFPGFVLFATVYLATLLEVVSWIRYVVWMNIGGAIYLAIILYNYCQKKKNLKSPGQQSQNEITNNNTSAELNHSVANGTARYDNEEYSTATAEISLEIIENEIDEQEDKIENVEYNKSSDLKVEEIVEPLEIPPVDYDQLSIEKDEVQLRDKSSRNLRILNVINGNMDDLSPCEDSQVIEINAIVHNELPESPISVVEVKDSEKISRNGILFVIGAYQPTIQQTITQELNGNVKKDKDFKNRLEQLLLERQSIIINNESDFDDDSLSIRSSAEGESISDIKHVVQTENNLELIEENGNENEVPNVTNEVALRSSKTGEVFDTVKKQKQKFENVLKEINPTIRNSLRRTESKASADFQQTYKF